MKESAEISRLKRKLKQYERVLDKMNACIYIMDQEPFRVSWMHNNDYLYRCSGYTSDDIVALGASFPEMIDNFGNNDESIYVAREYFKNHPDAKDWVGLYRMPDKEGNLLWVLYTSSILTRKSDGTPEQVLCVAINIKEEFNTMLSFDDFVNSQKRKAFQGMLEKCTKREIEVLKLISRGDAQKEIAAKLKISSSTVESHKSRLFKKLKARSSVELARIAISSGLLKNK